MNEKQMSANHQANQLTLTRRRVLQMIAGTSATLTAYPFITGFTQTGQADKGYGYDPNLMQGEVPWGNSLTGAQFKALEIVGDIILPADTHSPKASDLQIADFVSEWVSAPYPDQQNDRTIILGGLDWLDQQAKKTFGSHFIKASTNQQLKIFDELAFSVQSETARKEQSTFFNRLVFIFVGGFYTTQEGMSDIGYIGNVPLQRFDGPPLNIRERLGL